MEEEPMDTSFTAVQETQEAPNSVVEMVDNKEPKGGEVVQIVMQDQAPTIPVTTEQQYIQLTTSDGQAQVIPVTGQTQYIQLSQPDGSYQIIEVTPKGEARYIQIDSSSTAQLLSADSTDDKLETAVEAPQEITETHTHTTQIIEQSTDDTALVGTTVQVDDAAASVGSNTLNIVQVEPTAHVEQAIGLEHSAQVEHEVQAVHTAQVVQTTQVDNTGAVPKTTDLNTQIDVRATNPVSDINNVDMNKTEEPNTTSQTGMVTDSTLAVGSAEKPAVGSTVTASQEPAEPVKKILDLESPLKLTSESIVVVDGKKCVLRVDPQTNHLVAYPFKVDQQGKRRRGRPRKVPRLDDENSRDTEPSGDTSRSGAEDDLKDGPTEQENSAAQGLLGLSDAGPDGRRKSHRQRKKARFLKDYETGPVDEDGADAGDDEDEEVDVEDEDGDKKSGFPFKRGRGRPPKSGISVSQVQSMLVNMGVIPVKRGRGRPRRYPPKDSLPGPIPAFIIPSPDGQAVMMAPIPGLQNVQKSLIPIRPRTETGAEVNMTTAQASTSNEVQTSVADNPPIIIQNPDGTQMQVQLGDAVTSQTVPAQSDNKETVQSMLMLPSDMLGEDTSLSLQSTSNHEESDTGQEPEGGAAVLEDGDQSTEQQEEDNIEEDEVLEGHDEKKNKDLPPAAIIQLPQNLVPLLVPKKEPIKIGLKATEQELTKLKCPKCDFQGFYQQQYQDHIATHTEDIHKCKCCMFVSFDKDDLLAHFKDAHPKCICEECGFMAEHGYVIKRHMMRHNPEGCECQICGKRYKDQYILKMHVKMVHMPAEVLYECTACGKKFTRKAHLKRHLRIHEPEKPFKCPHCEYRGCERSDITKHLLIHEEPRHTCEVCGKAFRHIKNKELHVKRHKGQRDYKCGICDFYGYTFTDIRKHIERKHADSRAAICDKCGMVFKNDGLLRDHKYKCPDLSMDHSIGNITAVEGASTITIPASQILADTHLSVEDAHVAVDPGHIKVEGERVNIMVEEVLHDTVSLPDHQITVAEGTEVTAVELAPIPVSEAQEIQAHLAAMGKDPLHPSQGAIGEDEEVVDGQQEAVLEGVEEMPTGEVNLMVIT